MTYSTAEPYPSAPTGAYHPDLTTVAVHRYREPRIDADELVQALTCSLSFNGSIAGPYPVVNISSTGVAVETSQPIADEICGALTLRYCDRVVFSGPARVAYKDRDGNGVIGLHLSGGRVDARGLMHEAILAHKLRLQLEMVDQQMHALPMVWRAAVGDLRQLFDGLERLLNQRETDVDVSEVSDELPLLAATFAAWGPRLHEQLSLLHELSKDLEPGAQWAARDYAYRMLWPAVQSCVMHRRAHDKPRGYAGDYRMMLLYFAQQYDGPTRYARFLHYAAQRYSLGRAVVERQHNLRAAIRDATRHADQGEVPRIVSLASGPGLELATAIASGELRGPLELVLLDQDVEALAYAHNELSKLLQDDHSGLSLVCIPLAVKQLLSPKTELERFTIERHLSNASLVYCSGLYDYLPDKVAERLTKGLYRLLRPTGRLYLGNLVAAPDTTWMMDYVLDWKLIYRTEEDMLRLGNALTPAPSELSIERDQSGHAIFLSVRAPRPGGAEASA